MTVVVQGKANKPKKETWRKRIHLERWSISYKTIAIIIGLYTLSDIQVKFPQVSGEIFQQVCDSAACINAANRILQYMDQNKDPCGNFYDFACGNFNEDSSKPESEENANSALKDNIKETFLNMFKIPIQKDEPRPFQLVKKLYRSCMDKERIEKESLTTMKNILKDLGDWPVLHGDSWAEDNFTWTDCDYSLHKLGYHSYFWDFHVYGGYENSTNRIVLDVPELLINEADPDGSYNSFEYMVDVAAIFGANRITAESELKESSDLELALAEVGSNIQMTVYGIEHDRMTIAQLETKFPSIPWLEYINNHLAPDIQVTENETIIVPPLDYIADFVELISRTPKRVQANYVMWRVIADSIKYLNDDLRRRQSEFVILSGLDDEQRSRSDECLDETIERLDVATSAMYVKKYFSVKEKQTVMQMLSDIRSQFYESLKKVDWMDDNTRKYALEKAAAMTSTVGYQDELVNMTILEDYYKDLKLDNDDDYLQFILKINASSTRHSYRQLRQRFDRNDWKHNIYAHGYNVQYLLHSNKIEIPAGSLQGILTTYLPSYIYYASIGFIISSSLTNGFNKFGRFYDKNGNMVQESWWQNKTESAFDEKALCFSVQFEEFCYTQDWLIKKWWGAGSARHGVASGSGARLHDRNVELEIPNLYVQTKILADNGGFKIAYLAYNRWLERNELEPNLPGLNYTPQQMFWLSAANTLCSRYRPYATEIDYIPAKFRVFGSFSNTEQFAKDFNCPAGSSMNPLKRCKFW